MGSESVIQAASLIYIVTVHVGRSRREHMHDYPIAEVSLGADSTSRKLLHTSKHRDLPSYESVGAVSDSAVTHRQFA